MQKGLEGRETDFMAERPVHETNRDENRKNVWRNQQYLEAGSQGSGEDSSLSLRVSDKYTVFPSSKNFPQTQIPQRPLGSRNLDMSNV